MQYSPLVQVDLMVLAEATHMVKNLLSFERWLAKDPKPYTLFVIRRDRTSLTLRCCLANLKSLLEEARVCLLDARDRPVPSIGRQ